MRRSGLVLILLCQALALPAFAQQDPLLNSQSQTGWKAGDKCSSDSIAAYPDHDLAALRNRDAFMDKCLAKHHLPPRPHLAPGN
jgi:hypothetical protein